MELANEVLAELQLKQQEIIEILRKKLQVLEAEHAKLSYATGQDNLRIKQLEEEVKELRVLYLLPPDKLIN